MGQSAGTVASRSVCQQTTSLHALLHLFLHQYQSHQHLVLIASRYEAERLPQTVTSRIDPRDFDAQRTDYIPLQDQDTVTAADCIPSQQWLIEFLADFASLRAQLHKYACLFTALLVLGSLCRSTKHAGNLCAAVC